MDNIFHDIEFGEDPPFFWAQEPKDKEDVWCVFCFSDRVEWIDSEIVDILTIDTFYCPCCGTVFDWLQS